ncbi:hypothetical protein E2C01_066834 [Portunus trituberculatus]|uniref:Uncharacterized protein n=1 Tax=Portunus trituberculatus TaxID=210409 RepID=A0A5B7HVR7_PORTR|nr:hypothetical protein [Portunus trituberculatus]
MSTEVTGGKDPRMDGRSTLAVTILDRGVPSATGRGHLAHTEQEECAPASVLCRGAPDNEAHQFDGLLAVRTQLGARGVSEEGTEIIMASWKPGTERQYSPHIKRWSDFCSRGNINPLTFCLTFHRGVGYESINTVRGALSALGIVVEGCRGGNHPLINRFLSGVFNLHPSTSCYAATWDVKPVLQRIMTMDPLHSLSLKDLSFKLVMLMALMQAASVQTLHLLMLRNIAFGEDSISVLLRGNIKQCWPKFNVRTIEFRAYTQDNTLCVYMNSKECIERTENLGMQTGN